jgi:hypothetical protein
MYGRESSRVVTSRPSTHSGTRQGRYAKAHDLRHSAFHTSCITADFSSICDILWSWLACGPSRTRILHVRGVANEPTRPRQFCIKGTEGAYIQLHDELSALRASFLQRITRPCPKSKKRRKNHVTSTISDSLPFDQSNNTGYDHVSCNMRIICSLQICVGAGCHALAGSAITHPFQFTVLSIVLHVCTYDILHLEY